MTNEHNTWHPGELAVQRRAGVQEQMAELGQRLIRDYMPEQHREFFAGLEIIYLGGTDGAGKLWAIPVAGEPGFVASPDPKTLTIDLKGMSPALQLVDFSVGQAIGLLGIQLSTRRRNRLNGKITAAREGRLTVAVQQSFGNCPKYINQRELLPLPHTEEARRGHFRDWSDAAQQLVTRADTCFIASINSSGGPNRAVGIDLSHRGGSPGFIHFDALGRLIIPDYRGNNFFNTLGNLSVDSRAGLLFVDFATGDIMTLSMTAEVLWRKTSSGENGDTDRAIRLTLQEGYHVHHALPYYWQPITNEN